MTESEKLRMELLLRETLADPSRKKVKTRVEGVVDFLIDHPEETFYYSCSGTSFVMGHRLADENTITVYDTLLVSEQEFPACKQSKYPQPMPGDAGYKYTCAKCDTELDQVRPGKFACPRCW
jgi:hypothetical protein